MTRFDEKHRANLVTARQKVTERANTERSEDLRWMADWYETPRGAARRLGISVNSLRTWCQRNDLDVWDRLVENEQRRKGLAS